MSARPGQSCARFASILPALISPTRWVGNSVLNEGGMRKIVQRSAAVSVVATLAVLVVGCAAESPLESRLEFPVVYSPANSNEMRDFASSNLSLRQDGTAELNDFPVGEPRPGTSPSCMEVGGRSYSGEGEWKLLSEAKLELQTPDGVALLYASNGKFGSVDWLDVSLYRCDGVELTFGLSSQLKMPES